MRYSYQQGVIFSLSAVKLDHANDLFPVRANGMNSES